MVTRWKIKNALMKADNSIEEDEASYLADEIFECTMFDFPMEATLGLMILCLFIGWLSGHLF